MNLWRRSIILTTRLTRAMATSTSLSAPPPPSHILETVLYVRSMEVARDFYDNIINLKPDLATPDITTYPLGQTTLILFQLGGPHKINRYPSTERPHDIVPKHGPTEALLTLLMAGTNSSNSQTDGERVSLGHHYALAVNSVEDVEAWERHFEEMNKNELKVKVLGEMNWERGGRSLYFEDPDGHVGEVGSRGIWKHY